MEHTGGVKLQLRVKRLLRLGWGFFEAVAVFEGAAK